MQDRDIMERVSKLLDHNIRSRTPNGRNVRGESYKEIHKVRIAGHKAKKVIQAIYPYMSKRRQEKMREALEAWKPKTTYREGYTPKPKKEIDIPLLSIESDVVTLDETIIDILI